MTKTKPKAKATDACDLKYEIESEKLRLNRLKSERAALDLAIKQGKYRRVDDIEYDASETAALVITGLKQLPARLASACEGLTAAEISARIDKEVSAIVAELRKKAEETGLITVDEGEIDEEDD